ncbi:hypothetical protein HAX54_007398 [Datura stramonium]|uniref:Uncharacterized protein n=1 Tax=Datura stramonium TaxID=4076 RepID=A0ABS8RV42_DATST|nr:hypothetical protein [Datura stramonium]
MSTHFSPSISLAVVDNPVEEEDSDFLDFEEEDLDGVPDEDDSELNEELRGFRENLRQQKRNIKAAKKKQKTKKSSKIQEVELGEAGVDREFEDIFKNKVDKCAGRLGSDEDFIGSSDEPNEDNEEELDVLSQPDIDLPSRRKSRKLRYDDSSAISFFESGMIFESAIEFRKVVVDYAIQEKVQLKLNLDEPNRLGDGDGITIMFDMQKENVCKTHLGKLAKDMERRRKEKSILEPGRLSERLISSGTTSKNASLTNIDLGFKPPGLK